MNQRTVWGAVFFALSKLPAFFFVFVTVFADGGAPSEYVMAFGLIAGAYLLLGTAAGYVLQTWKAGFLISATAVIIIVLYSLEENERLLLHAGVVLDALVAAGAGAWIGARLRARRLA